MNQTNHSSIDLSMQDDFISAFGATEDMQNSEEDFFADADLFSAEENEPLELPENLFEEDEQTNLFFDEEALFVQDQEQESLSAKFLGNEISLPKKEMLTLAKALGISVDNCIRLFQKGMNYDRLQKRLEGQNADKNIAVPRLLPQAKKNAAKPKDALEHGQEQEKRYENRENSRSARKASWQEAMLQYPEFDLKKLTPEELSKINAGENVLNILQQREIEELRQKLVMAEQKKKSATRALGSVKSDAAEDMDDFLAGFLSV